jgi:hypothetical protein
MATISDFSRRQAERLAAMARAIRAKAGAFLPFINDIII